VYSSVNIKPGDDTGFANFIDTHRDD
jgi:hypothetical protein